MLECPWIFTLDLDMMLILWPLDPRNRLFLPISNDLNLDLVILNCNRSLGMPYDFLLLEMRLSGFCWFGVSRLYILFGFSLLYDFVAFLCILCCNFLLLCNSVLVSMIHLCIAHFSIIIFSSYHDLSNSN